MQLTLKEFRENNTENNPFLFSDMVNGFKNNILNILENDNDIKLSLNIVGFNLDEDIKVFIDEKKTIYSFFLTQEGINKLDRTNNFLKYKTLLEKDTIQNLLKLRKIKLIIKEYNKNINHVNISGNYLIPNNIENLDELLENI